MIFLNKERKRMIEKKYQHFDKLNTSQLLLHSRFSGITTTDDTQTLGTINVKKDLI